MGERFVYVIGSEAGPNKIGISNDVVKRLAYIRSASGQPHRIMHQSAVPAGLAAKIERRAHWYLKDFHMTGEWFAAPADRAIDAIERASADRGEGPCCLRIGRQKQWTERLHLTMPDRKSVV